MVRLQTASKTPSMRDLARALNLSATTVSQALRDKPRVKSETRERVRAAAEAAGYQSNPFAGSIMAEMRRRRGAAFHGVVAIVDMDGPEGRSAASAAYHRELIEGAQDRAVELGIKPQIVSRDTCETGGQNIANWLKGGGVHAAFLLPVRERSTLRMQQWSHYALVYADYCDGEPVPHGICPDHFGAMQMALGRLQQLGYRRPGLALEQSEESRLRRIWGSAFGCMKSDFGMSGDVPVLVAPGIRRGEFSEWFRAHDPDVVIGHDAGIIDWMRACGARIPETHGFCCLNIIKNPDIACTGIDLQPRALGARGIELVVAQLQRGEHGLPEHPSSTTIPPAWVDGSTLRAACRGAISRQMAGAIHS